MKKTTRNLLLGLMGGIIIGLVLNVLMGPVKIERVTTHITECPTVEPQEGEFGDDSEIGKPCSTDSDCRLPYSYALRSSCPYRMRCSDGACEVFCPWHENTTNST